MPDSNVPPPWLLIDANLLAGEFNEERTVITGRHTGHSMAVSDIGNGPSTNGRCDLTKRSDWGTIRKKLIDEGYTVKG